MSEIPGHMALVRVTDAGDIVGGLHAVRVVTCAVPRRTGVVLVAPARWARLQTVLEKEPDMVCSVDPAGMVTWDD